MSIPEISVKCKFDEEKRELKLNGKNIVLIYINYDQTTIHVV